MHILITNIVLDARTGTEIVTRDLALGLRARGHKIEVFTDRTGGVSDEIVAAGIPLHTDPARLRRPDVVHVNHFDHARPVFERFPDVPAMAVCHDPVNLNAVSMQHSSVRRWCAVSENCRKRVCRETGLPREAVTLLPNYVDLSLAGAPVESLGPGRRWLYAAEKRDPKPLRRRIQALGLLCGRRVDQVAHFSKPQRIVENYPALARNYELVFASDRCALEAAATGVPVVVCDPRGIAGLLTPDTWRKWSDHNLGELCFKRPVSLWALATELMKADREQAETVARLIRQERLLDAGLDRLEAIYADIAPAPAMHRVKVS
jgi:glycosyl transferase family 4